MPVIPGKEFRITWNSILHVGQVPLVELPSERVLADPGTSRCSRNG